MELYRNVFSKESGIIHEFGLSVYYVGVYAVLISSLGIYVIPSLLQAIDVKSSTC